MTEAPAVTGIPAPATERRDDIGRLVALTWHGSGARAVNSSNRWLVAVDGSACSLRAVAMAARLAALGDDGEVDIVHVEPWLVKEAAETELARRSWAVTAPARELLDAASVGWRLHVLMGEAASQIVGLAETPGFAGSSGLNGLNGINGIVIGSRGQGMAESLMLGSVADKVVHQARLPVMIVR